MTRSLEQRDGQVLRGIQVECQGAAVPAERERYDFVLVDAPIRGDDPGFPLGWSRGNFDLAVDASATRLPPEIKGAPEDLDVVTAQHHVALRRRDRHDDAQPDTSGGWPCGRSRRLDPWRHGHRLG